jgi:hypothetical membrane protein
MTLTAPARPRVGLIVGGAAWMLATVQYAVAQVVVASAWKTPWSWRHNYVSDLGNTACGMFAVPHGTPAYVCSPLHAVMNSSFVTSGLLTLAGAVLLRSIWPARPLTTVAVVLWITAGLGKMVVGLVPENSNANLHLLGALNLPLGAVAILLLGLAGWRDARAVSMVGIVVAVVELAGSILSAAGQYAGPALYLGLGAGGMERLAGYPGNLWMAMIGVVAVLAARPRETGPVAPAPAGPGTRELRRRPGGRRAAGRASGR